MPRYIDADKIDFSAIKDDFDRARAKVIIMGQPTADVVEVVRCKDCVYRMELSPLYQYEGGSLKVCFIRNKPVSDNGYCSDARRKVDE